MLLKNIRFFLFLLVGFIIRVLGKKTEPLTYKLIEETTMGLIYEIKLPSAGAPDVVRRVFTYSINGESKDIELLFSENVVTLPPIKDGSKVELHFREIDDAGNSSENSDTLHFTATDTIAPPKPGAFVVSLVREVADPEVVSPPEVAPEVKAVEPSSVVEAEAVVAPIKTEDRI